MGMMSISVFKGRGLVVYRQEDFELEITTLSPEDAIILGQILYRSKINVIKKSTVVEKETGKRKRDWKRYISKPTLRKIELVMREMGTFNTKDIMSKSGFSRTTILRAIRVLKEMGKLKIDEKTGKMMYVG